MPGKLTTHVLDTAAGRPAAGMKIQLVRFGPGDVREKLAEVVTNENGRTDDPVLSGDDFVPGVYELVFDVGSYFARSGRIDNSIPFLDQVPVRFGIADATAHYHVPLLVTPWAYSTYRGS